MEAGAAQGEAIVPIGDPVEMPLTQERQRQEGQDLPLPGDRVSARRLWSEDVGCGVPLLSYIPRCLIQAAVFS